MEHRKHGVLKGFAFVRKNFGIILHARVPPVFKCLQSHSCSSCHRSRRLCPKGRTSPGTAGEPGPVESGVTSGEPIERGRLCLRWPADTEVVRAGRRTGRNERRERGGKEQRVSLGRAMPSRKNQGY